ncbi:MAG TPA: hypothetical protein VGC78_12320 [Gaiellaceae bacterium]|jgi:hypothetical protein
MDKIFRCELDGLVMSAESEAELLAQIEAHLAEEHPHLVGRLGRDEILADIRKQTGVA